MTRRILPALALASLLVAGGAPAEARTSGVAQPDLLDRAVKAWAKVKTARATFEQTIVNPLTERTLTASGEFQQQRPGRLSVTFSNPSSDRIVADGKYVWLYLPSSAPDQVIRTPLGAAGTGVVDPAQFLTSPRTRFTVTPAGPATVSGHATHGYTLVPKVAETAVFRSAVIWIDDADAVVRQFDVTEAGGLKRTVRLTSLKTNVKVDAGAFRFTPPAGVRVVAR